MNHKRQVFRTQHLVQEAITGRPFLLQHSSLAQTRVHQQPQAQRHIIFARKIVNGLRFSIFIHRKILFLQIRNNLSMLIPHRGRNAHRLHVHGDLRRSTRLRSLRLLFRHSLRLRSACCPESWRRRLPSPRGHAAAQQSRERQHPSTRATPPSASALRTSFFIRPTPNSLSALAARRIHRCRLQLQQDACPANSPPEQTLPRIQPDIEFPLGHASSSRFLLPSIHAEGARANLGTPASIRIIAARREVRHYHESRIHLIHQRSMLFRFRPDAFPFRIVLKRLPVCGRSFPVRMLQNINQRVAFRRLIRRSPVSHVFIPCRVKYLRRYGHGTAPANPPTSLPRHGKHATHTPRSNPRLPRSKNRFSRPHGNGHQRGRRNVFNMFVFSFCLLPAVLCAFHSRSQLAKKKEGP